jgi:tripartite-type tricarboxylate transporter receptor subunit TctC
MTSTRSALRAGLLGLAIPVLLAAAIAQASEYPNRSIRFITPAAPGGTTDILARLIGAKLGEALHQQVVVDNRASASGVIAAELTTAALPDGYTIFMGYHQHIVNAALNPKLPYHPVNDFTPITQATQAGLMLVVNPSTPAKNLKEFVDWTKNFKGALNFGSAGLGSGGHLAGELYNLAAGVKAQHIPYKGSGPALIDLVGGQYHYNFAGIQAAQTLVRAGKLRGIAVTTPRRIAAIDLPAMAEALPGFELVGWYGVLGPPRMPKPILARLNAEIVKIIKSPDISERILGDGSEPIGNTPEEFRVYLLQNLKQMTELVKKSGAKLD